MMPRPNSLALLSLLISSVFLCGCLSSQDREISPPEDQMHLTDMEQTALESNRFALDVYGELAGEEENVFFSPWSLSSALAMTYEGAAGRTAEEMRSVLHFSGNDSLRRQSFSALDRSINANDSGYTLSTASGLWVDDDFSLRQEYADLVNDYYHARAVNVDFRGAPTDARQTINSWVEQKTANKIKDLLAPSDINDLTRLVLTNAIYFNGTWIREFDRSLTWDEAFYAGDGRTVMVPMMRQTGEEARFNYLETADMQMLQMPYMGENLSMAILLPRGHDITPLEESLSMEKLAQWREGMQMRRVDVYIPKFKISADYRLAENLTNLGMPTAFTEAADLSGMSAGKRLLISDVIHQAYVDVNEEGTEAAAATATIVEAALPAPAEKVPVFRADHPFLFMIQEDETGCILFLGRVSDPGKG